MTAPSLVLATAPVTIEDRYGPYSAAANTQPSFGLLSLAASALEAGAEVSVVEASALNLGIRETIDSILRISPDILGISATSLGIVPAATLAKEVKLRAPKTLIVIGGCHVSALPEETMKEFREFDLGVIGEGEVTLSDIVRRITEGDDLTDIPGTCYRTDTGVKLATTRPPIEDLDSLPLPAWSLLDGFPTHFKPSPARILRWPCASVVMTRGCPNRCTFCDRSVFGRRCRSYSPKYAADLCEDLHRNFGVKEILIEDDTFIMARKNVEGFCKAILDRDLDISWSCLGRADRVDLELLKLMKRAGCWHISFGIESGDEQILKAANKNLNLEQILAALTMCRTARIRTKGFFMVGFPEESEASLRATEDLVRKLPLDDISVMHLTPFPGSEIYESASSMGVFEQDWTTMNALNPVFIPNGMTKKALEDGRNRILKAFFSRRDVIMSHAKHAIRHPRLLPHYLSGAKSLIQVLR